MLKSEALNFLLAKKVNNTWKSFTSNPIQEIKCRHQRCGSYVTECKIRRMSSGWDSWLITQAAGSPQPHRTRRRLIRQLSPPLRGISLWDVEEDNRNVRAVRRRTQRRADDTRRCSAALPWRFFAASLSIVRGNERGDKVYLRARGGMLMRTIK